MSTIRVLSPSRLRSLGRDASGVAMTEFALALPLLLTAGLYGVETAHLAMVNMRVSQVALQLADNGSRIGDTSTLENRRIYESDVNDILIGAEIEAGAKLDLYEHGRVIVSSLEVVDGTTDDQYIHWQRCAGKNRVSSAYGGEGTGLGASFAGMGPAGEEITAEPGEAVIFVEVSYDYQPLISSQLTTARTLTATAAYNVRDSRDLSQIYQRDVARPDPVASCSAYTASRIPRS